MTDVHERLKRLARRSDARVLFLILCFAFVVRAWNVAANPPGLFCDEADIANNAHSLLTTGRDNAGVWFPVFFSGLGDYKNPVPIYSAIPSIAVLGMNRLAVRAVGVVYGVLAVIAMYFLASGLFHATAGLWAALLMAMSPWHIHLSRIGMEFSPVIFFTTAALACFAWAVRGEAWRWLPGAYLCAVGALLSYYSAWIYFPPVCLVLALIYRREACRWMGQRWFWVTTGVIAVAFAAMVLPYFLDGRYLTRWRNTRSDLTWPMLRAAYLNHFSSAFLFRGGDAGFYGALVVRHSTMGMGQLYWFQFPALVACLLAWFRLPHLRRGLLLIAALIVLFPLGTVFTALNPYATRSYLGVIAFTAASGLGLCLIMEELARYRRVGAVAGMLVVLTMSAAFAVFADLQQLYPRRAGGWEGWQIGMREALEFMRRPEIDARYDRMLITHGFNSGEALFKFYSHEFRCPKCSMFGPEHVPDGNPKNLYAIRWNEALVALDRRPYLEFQRLAEIATPGGPPELYIGTFQRKTAAHAKRHENLRGLTGLQR